MEEYIQLGPLNMKVQLLILLLSGLLAYCVMRYKAKTDHAGEQAVTILVNAVCLGLFIWKASYLVLHPVLTMKHPSYLLYFTGGETGMILGIAAAVIYVLIALSRTTVSLSSLTLIGLLGSSAFLMVYEGGRAVLEGSGQSAVLFAACCLLSFLFLFKRNKHLLFAATFLLAGTLTVSLIGTQNKQEEKPAAAMSSSSGLKRGQTPPPFTLPSLDGKQVSLSQYKGKVVFLNFWASWCPPCQAEMPEMERFNKKHKGKDAVILAVNLTSDDTKDAARAFAKKHDVTFPVLLDEQGKVSGRYHAFTLPTTYIIDKKGKVVQLHIGPLNVEMMESFLR